LYTVQMLIVAMITLGVMGYPHSSESMGTQPIDVNSIHQMIEAHLSPSEKLELVKLLRPRNAEAEDNVDTEQLFFDSKGKNAMNSAVVCGSSGTSAQCLPKPWCGKKVVVEDGNPPGAAWLEAC